MTSHDVRDMLDLPGTAGPRPAKKQKIAAPKSTLKGLAREVQSLGGDNPIAIVPEISVFKKRRLASRKPAAKWELKSFKNSARGEDTLVLQHWRRKAEVPAAPVGDGVNDEEAEPKAEPEIDDSTFAKFNVKVNILHYNDEQYNLKLQSEDWSRDETDYLMGLIEEYDLRWPVIWDRYEYATAVSEIDGAEDAIIPAPKVRSMEDMKARYYFIADNMLTLQKPPEKMVQAEHDLHEILKNFNPAQETLRKKFAETAFNRTKDEAKEEESLLLELKRILARSEKLSEERRELYARLEAPPSTGNIGVYTSSQGLQQLLQQLMTVDKSKKRRSLMGSEGISPASGPNGLQQPGIFDRRENTMRESMAGPSNASNKKGTPQGPTERRQLTEEEERVYGVSAPTEKLSGPSFRHDRLSKPVTSKSSTQQAKILNVLTEVGIPARLIMPTAEVGVEWDKLLTDVWALIDLKRKEEKADADLALATAYKAEKEKKERAEKGNLDQEPPPADENGNEQGNGGGGEDQDGDVKMEDDEKEKSAAPSMRGVNVQKRSASVLSAVSDKSTKRQKK